MKTLFSLAFDCARRAFLFGGSDDPCTETGAKKEKKISVGGQALIEGMLMIGPRKVAIAIRKPDNEIDLKINPILKKTFLQKVPFLRGAINLFKQMKIGVGALMYSAQYMEIEDGDGSADAEPTRFERFLDEKLGDKAKDVIVYFAVVLSLLFSVGLFILLPNFIAGFIPLSKANRSGMILLNLCEGCIRVCIFLAYLAFSSRLQEISRLWQYHGAEHKTIHCFEYGDPLEIGYVRKYSVKHPRCGTSFLFLVMIISILVFSIVDLAFFGIRQQLAGVIRVLFSFTVRLLTIPVVAGAAYEVIKLSGRYNNAFTRVISIPGLFFQRFTTKEPDDGMIEVAIKAFENAITEDEKEMAW